MNEDFVRDVIAPSVQLHKHLTYITVFLIQRYSFTDFTNFSQKQTTEKVIKKLRIRNYPSIALFHDGSKKEVWKADMDGEVDCSSKDIKSAIDEVLSGDVF